MLEAKADWEHTCIAGGFIFFALQKEQEISFQDFLLNGAADRRLLFSFESSGQSGLKIEYFTTQKERFRSPLRNTLYLFALSE